MAFQASRRLRFSLASIFLLTFVSAAAFAWLRPGPEKPRVQTSMSDTRYGGVHEYVVSYPNGHRESYVDGFDLGTPDFVGLGDEEGHTRIGYCESDRVSPFTWRTPDHGGLIQPGDETLCHVRFRALVAEIERRPKEQTYSGYQEMTLPHDWPQLEDLLREAHAR